jgi:hypothetical protein
LTKIKFQRRARSGATGAEAATLRAVESISAEVHAAAHTNLILMPAADEATEKSSFATIHISAGGRERCRVVNRNALGSVGIQDSHSSMAVIQAWDGPIRFD